jgi:hypothetical protein
MEERRVDTSPRGLARVGGALYLIIIAVGIFGEAFVRGRLIVAGDAAATAANIRSMEPLWRFGIAAELFLLIWAVTVGWILFVLLRPVSRDLAWLATFFNLVSIALEAGIQLQLLAILLPAFVGEASLCLWLLVKGLNVEAWSRWRGAE